MACVRMRRARDCDVASVLGARRSRAHARRDVHRELAIRRAGGAFRRTRGVWLVRAQRARARTLGGARRVARGG